MTDHLGPPPPPKRHRLPDIRKSITHKFKISGESGYFTIGLYPDGSPGEIFVSFAKAGSRLRGPLDAWATAVSIALQSGIPLETIVDKFKHWKFEPSGITSGDRVKFCDSPLDYICKWLEAKFLTEKGE